MPSFRASEVIIHPDVDDAYRTLEKQASAGAQPAAAIWKSLQTTFARAKTSAQFADPIPIKRIPAHFRQTYGVQNLYCADLAWFWRAFYTMVGRRVVFLDLVDHRQYDAWFASKGK